ncbi:MAG TPA: PP2C family protein-serine/threonine phosphatase [Terriglobales bacterium]
MKIDSRSLIRFLRQQGLYVFIAVVVAGIFWAIGQPRNFSTVIVYSLCLGNLTSIPMEALGHLYAPRPFPYNWLIFLALLSVSVGPVYTISTVIVWFLTPVGRVPLWTVLTQNWKFSLLVTLVFSVMAFLYNVTKARLEQRNVELQKSVEQGAAQIEMQDREMERARDIQQSLLPKNIPQLPGFEIAAAWYPARAVGGDYYDVLAIGKSRIAFCIADVVGKGVSAALLMANVQATVRAFTSELVNPAGLCSKVNSVLCGNIGSDKFVTFFCGVLDAERRTLQYCNAGHLYPILVSSGSVQQLDQGDAVLGVFPDWKYTDSMIELKPGDRLLLFTDGITEATGSDGQEFGLENIAAFARVHRPSSASALTKMLLAQVTDFCRTRFQDDATLLVIAAD